MSLRLKTAPAAEPVSLSEAKEFLRIVDSADDALLTQMIASTRRSAEIYTGRALISQTWVQMENKVAGRRIIPLARPPLQSVVAVKTYDAENSAVPFSSTAYWVDTDSVPGRIVLKPEADWPAHLRPCAALEVEFNAGYGASASAVPEPLRIGMLMLMKYLYAAKTRLLESKDMPDLGPAEGEVLPVPVRNLWEAYRLPLL